MHKSAKLRKLMESTTGDPRWKAIIERDKSADGTFYYAVKTTGIYCRPSCSARVAHPENVQFHATIEDAERAGFRACKRCRPSGASRSDENTATLAKVCRLIENAETPPTLETLAKFAGMSMFHLHRIFKAGIGLTPAAYAASQRSGRVRKTLGKAQSITEAIYGAGFQTSSRFYEATSKVLGMTPTSFRDGGANTTIHFALGECSLGSILVAKSDRGVCAVLLGDDPQQLARDLQDQFPRAEIIGDESGYEALIAQVVGLIDNPKAGLDLPLDIRGTAFQHRVWTALQQIPAGATASYTEIANRIGMPKAFRAVAQACGANMIAVAIPCHRVVRTDGGLSGYRWGVERKRALLKKEAAI